MSSNYKTRQVRKCLLLGRILLSMMLFSRSMGIWKLICIYFYVGVINCHFHLLQSLASSFCSQNLLLFLKLSSSCFLLTTPFLPSVLQLHHERGNFFFQLAFLSRRLFRSVLFSFIHSTIPN